MLKDFRCFVSVMKTEFPFNSPILKLLICFVFGVFISCISIINLGCNPSKSDPKLDKSKAVLTKHKNVGINRTKLRSVSNNAQNSAVMEREDSFWKRAQQEVYRSPEELYAQDVRERRRGQFLPKLVRGNRSQKLFALTFDDGPHPIYTLKLLQVLKKANVKATFFVVGKMVEKQPDLLKAIDNAGMEIGNHTFSHVNLTKIPVKDIETEYRANNDIVTKVIGKSMMFCRPPGGDYDADVINAATSAGLTTVLWTDDPGDYANPSNNKLKKRTLARLSNGGILLLHDGIKGTLLVLPQIIAYAKKQGFRFVTVTELQNSLRSHR